MLRAAREAGVTVCVATPHCTLHHESSIGHFLERREAAYRLLLEHIRVGEADAYPEILLGAEVYLDHDISKGEGIERLCIADTPYLLVEFPGLKRHPLTAEWLYALTCRGIKPLIAHIDRYIGWRDMVDDFQGIPMTYQINDTCFLTMSDRRKLKKIIPQCSGFLVSSDMHNTDSRATEMGKAYRIAKKHWPQAADDWFTANAEHLLAEKRMAGTVVG